MILNSKLKVREAKQMPHLTGVSIEPPIG